MPKQAAVLTASEFKRLLAVTAASPFAKRDTLLVLMSFGLGLRAIELAALKIHQVINDQGKVKDVLYLTKTKGDEPREAYLTEPKIRKAIEEYINERQQIAIERRKFYHPKQPLFLSQKNDHFSNKTLSKRFSFLYKEAGIERASSHSGRRTFATNLIEKGVDIKAVSTLMGHASIQMTALYVQDNPERLKKITSQALSFI